MTVAAVREKLYDYIRVADDKKIKAIYTMLEDEMTQQLQWWNDNAIMQELDSRYQAWEKGSDKGHSLAEVEASIEQLKKRRKAK
jgi:hypothetical protein